MCVVRRCVIFSGRSCFPRRHYISDTVSYPANCLNHRSPMLLSNLALFMSFSCLGWKQHDHESMQAPAGMSCVWFLYTFSFCLLDCSFRRLQQGSNSMTHHNIPLVIGGSSTTERINSSKKKKEERKEVCAHIEVKLLCTFLGVG